MRPFAERRTVTPRSRNGMVESLRVLKVCRKTEVQDGRIVLQIIQTTIVCAPDRLRDLLRNMTRMQLIRTLAALRPNMTGYRDVEEAYRIARSSGGLNSAAQFLLTSGENPERLKSEASFAALSSVSPVPALSGNTTRHRLNLGGDGAANSALRIIAIGRMRLDPKTKEYVNRRTAKGHSKLETIRCLKRYIVREVFNAPRAATHRSIRRISLLRT